MDSSEKMDRRLRQRLLQRGRIARAEVEKGLRKLPDLSDRVAKRGAEELSSFRAELEAERELRVVRIKRAVARALEPAPRIVARRAEPLDESEI